MNSDAALVAQHHEWVVRAVLDSGLSIGDLAASTGLSAGRIQAWLDGEEPSDWLTLCKLLTLLVRERAVAWGA